MGISSHILTGNRHSSVRPASIARPFSMQEENIGEKCKKFRLRDLRRRNFAAN
jgi:hypothetical protein